MGHNCILCGAELPNKRGGRCYCPSCSAYMREKRLQENNEERKVLRIKHEIEPKPAEKKRVTLRKSDIKYCMRCEYHGNFIHQILCDHLCKTGQRRGCPPGVGCDKRRIEG